MTDNVTNMLVAQLLLRPSSNPAPSWLQPFLLERQDFNSQWPPNDDFGRRRASDWFRPEDMYNEEGVVPPEKDAVWPLELDYRYDPFRRRLDEYDHEYPRRPLRRR